MIEMMLGLENSVNIVCKEEYFVSPMLNFIGR